MKNISFNTKTFDVSESEDQKRDKNKKISLIIVGYNEEKNIYNTLKKVYAFFKKTYTHYEIIFVNDGSTDKTLEIVTSFSKQCPINVISNSKNNGKGFVVRQGILSATGDFIIITDADLAYPIEQIGPFIDACKVTDIVVGTRIHKDSVYLMNHRAFQLILLRHVTSRLFNKYVNLLFDISASDTQCGLKVFKAKIAKEIAQASKINGFSYDVEIFVLAKKLEAKVTELPIHVVQTYPDSKVIIWKHSPKMFLEALQIKYNELTGVYTQK